MTQSRVVWVVRGLTLVMSNHILFRWEVEALLLHPRAHACTHVHTPRRQLQLEESDGAITLWKMTER